MECDAHEYVKTHISIFNFDRILAFVLDDP